MRHNSPSHAVIACGLSLAAHAGAAHAQPPALATTPGFAAHTSWEDFGSPWGFGGFAVGPAPDDVFVAAHGELRRFDAQGGSHVVHVLPPRHAFGLLAAAGSEVLFSDFQANVLHRLDVWTGAQGSQPLPANAFDLAATASGALLVNANPLWPAPGAAIGIWLVDPLRGGAHREVARLSGPSGPLAIDGNGDLLVAVLPEVVPPAPGSVRILRLARARLDLALAGGTAATSADFAVALPALDGAFDMVFDDRGRLLISDVNTGAIRRSDTGVTTLEARAMAGPGLDAPHGMQFVARGSSTFDAFQPDDSSALYVASVVYGTRSAVHRIAPARPELASSVGPSIPLGPFAIDARGLPPLSNAWLCVSPVAPVPERALPIPGPRPVWLGLDLAAPIVAAPVASDQAGAWRLPFSHAAGALALTLQAVALDAASAEPALVTSPPLLVLLLDQP